MATELVFTPRTATPTAAPHAWLHRYRELRMRLAWVVAVVALGVGLVWWLARTMLSIQPGPGTPIGPVVRTDHHVATWIQTLEPYLPSLHRDAGQDRYALAVCLIPLDGGPTALVPVHRQLTPSQLAMARILGSDGQSLWVDGPTTDAIDLRTGRLRREPGPVPRNLVGTPTSVLLPDPRECLAAGYLLDDQQWLGLLSEAEVARSYGPRQFVRRVVPAEPTRGPRRFHRAAVERDDSGQYFRVAGIRAIGEREHCNAAFLRPSASAEPFRLREPSGAILLAAAGPELAATLVVARTTDDGEVVWQRDTGIDRFALQQILPGDRATVFVGTRPREPGRVPEPLVVIVEHQHGGITTHSLWR